MCNLKKQKNKALFLKLAGLATYVLFVCLSLACEQAREPAPDVGATVDAAVAATLQAQSAVPPSAPTPTVDALLAATVEAQSVVPPSLLTPTIDASLAATLASAAATFEAESAVPPSALPPTIDASLAATLASAAATFEAQSAVPSSAPTPTNVGQTTSAPMPTTVAVPTQTLTPRPTPTTVPTPAPTPFDIKMANCRQEDTGGYQFDRSEGPDSYEQWGVREWYRTTWSGDYPKADRIRCLTSVHDSIEDARWSLIYSTALQRGEWSQAGLLEHRQIAGVNIGEDSLAFEIETGRGSLPDYVSANFLIRRGIVVIHLEAISDIGGYNPKFRRNARNAFFGSVWSPLIEIAHHADGRLLAELDRAGR